VIIDRDDNNDIAAGFVLQRKKRLRQGGGAGLSDGWPTSTSDEINLQEDFISVEGLGGEACEGPQKVRGADHPRGKHTTHVHPRSS
jgi:hypothetical protein